MRNCLSTGFELLILASVFYHIGINVALLVVPIKMNIAVLASGPIFFYL
jgi:hypothetical protein